MKYWDEVLFPSMFATIRGERYLVMSEAQIREELVNLTKRAISRFKFPKQSTAYSRVTAYEDDIPYDRYYFVNDNLTDAEIEVIIAWMKAFWFELLVSNSDNFVNLYHDSTIKTYSPGNVLHNYLKAQEAFKSQAKEIESFYYRSNPDFTPAIDGISDE